MGILKQKPSQLKEWRIRCHKEISNIKRGRGITNSYNYDVVFPTDINYKLVALSIRKVKRSHRLGFKRRKTDD